MGFQPTRLLTTLPAPAIAAVVFFLFWISAPLLGQSIQHGGKDYVGLSTIASRLGMKLERSGNSAILKSDWTRIEVQEHKRHIELNGIQVHLGDAVIARGSMLYISELDYTKTVQPLLTPQVFRDPPRLRRIILDPGHGGKDAGAQNKELNLHEKHLALDLARRLKKILEQRGYQVQLTRNNDTFIALNDRPAMAARMSGDLFVSLHFNAAGASSVHGIETYILTPQNQASTAANSIDRAAYLGNQSDSWNPLIGYYIQREMVSQLKARDRGLKRARFAVLRDARSPAVLVEGGFVSNDREGRNIGWDAYRDKMAKSIADGIDAYQKTLNRVSAQQQKK